MKMDLNKTRNMIQYDENPANPPQFSSSGKNDNDQAIPLCNQCFGRPVPLKRAGREHPCLSTWGRVLCHQLRLRASRPVNWEEVYVISCGDVVPKLFIEPGGLPDLDGLSTSESGCTMLIGPDLVRPADYSSFRRDPDFCWVSQVVS